MPKYFYTLYRQNTQYAKHIEGLRAFAAVRVMIYHIAVFASLFLSQAQYLEMLKHPLFKLAISTSVTLDTFFVISGLVIGYSLIKEYKEHGKVNLYDFYVRRIARVYPLYLVILFVGVPFCYRNLHNIWTNILQINNVLLIQNQYLAWTWSLAVDFQFYIIFSVILWLLSKKIIGKRACCSLILAFFLLPFGITHLLIVANHYYHFTSHVFVLTSNECSQYVNMGFDKLYVRSYPILFGVLTAYLMVYHRTKIHEILQQISTRYINLLSLALLASIFLLIYNDPIWYLEKSRDVWQTSTYWIILIQRILYSVVLSCIILLADAPKGIVIKSIVRFLSMAVLRPFGRLSFTSYMIHPFIILIGYFFYFAIHTEVTAHEYFQQGLFLIGVTYLFALPLYLYIEQPAMRWVKKKMLKSRGISAAPSTVVVVGEE